MRKNKLFLFGVISVAILLMFQAPLVLAQEQRPDQPGQYPEQGPPPSDQGAPADNQAPAQDPPSRVARVHEMVGSVSYQPGGQGDWVQAVSNRPLTTGDNVWADKDSRAELQIGSTAVRLDAETSLTLLQLDDRTTQLRLSLGSLIVRIRHLDDEDHFEIDTPNEAFVIQRPGEYRVDVNSDGSESDVTVWKGRGEVTGGGSSYDVVAGQRATFTGTDQLDHEIQQVPPQDDFDQWAFGRDDHEDRAESANYISPEITGAEDLDEYGQWHYAADYGQVWTPAGVAVGWAPYRFGHWVWIAPWGWTWVEDEPWGFAPFHYGRWAFVSGAWCWAPGPVVVRPVYAPAFVAFVGGVGFGIGANVAWFPLAPHEVFVPWYHTSPVYVNNVNITNTRVSVTQITNVYHTTIINNNTTVNRITYVNQRVPTAVTAVSHDTFANARPVQANLVHVDQKTIENAPVARNIPVQPVRQSVQGAGRVSSYHPPAAVQNRQVVATRPPAPRAGGEQRPAAMNVRAETPGKPQPPVRNEAASRPPANPRLDEQGTPQRPESQPETARPQPPQAGEAARPEAAQRPPAPRTPANVPRPPSAEYNHPLVRQAPPVQQRPEVQRSEEQKFNTWQQQRPQQAPRPSAPAPRPSAPPPHEERPHK
ncbi:MAG TPA: DUF6600 domain-containing protein [Terriglobales bacterium]|nr:DUF6600 domain-containing protein [Terriglobales bacterium]